MEVLEFAEASACLGVPCTLDVSKVLNQRDFTNAESIFQELESGLIRMAIVGPLPGPSKRVPLVTMLMESHFAKHMWEKNVKQVVVLLATSRSKEKVSLGSSSGSLTWTVPLGSWREKKFMALQFPSLCDAAIPLLYETETVTVAKYATKLTRMLESMPELPVTVSLESWDWFLFRVFTRLPAEDHAAVCQQLLDLIKGGLKPASFGLLHHFGQSDRAMAELKNQTTQIIVQVCEKAKVPVEAVLENDGTVIISYTAAALLDEKGKGIRQWGELIDPLISANVLEELLVKKIDDAWSKLHQYVPTGITVVMDLSFTETNKYRRFDFHERRDFLSHLAKESALLLKSNIVKDFFRHKTAYFFNAIASLVRVIRIMPYFSSVTKEENASLIGDELRLHLSEQNIVGKKTPFAPWIWALKIDSDIVDAKQRLMEIKPAAAEDVIVEYDFESHVDKMRDSLSLLKILHASMSSILLRGNMPSGTKMLVVRPLRKTSSRLCIEKDVAELTFELSSSSTFGLAEWRALPVVNGSLSGSVPENRKVFFPERRQESMSDPNAFDDLSQSVSLDMSFSSLSINSGNVQSLERRRRRSISPAPVCVDADGARVSRPSPPPSAKKSPRASPPSSRVPPPSVVAVEPEAQPQVLPILNSPNVPIIVSPSLSTSMAGRRPSLQDVKGWGSTEVAAWAEELGLPIAGIAFQQHAVDGESFLDLSREELKEIGVVQLGPLKKLIRERDKILRERDALLSEKWSEYGNTIPHSQIVLVRKVGGGHYGEVWEAAWGLAKVAVKWLKNTDGANETFIEEIEILKRVRHPHVIESFGVSLDEQGMIRLVTELLDGSLLDYCRNSMLVSRFLEAC